MNECDSFGIVHIPERFLTLHRITSQLTLYPITLHRITQVVADPRCSKSGVYWSWNGGPRQGRGMEALKNGGNIIGAGGAGGDWESIFENDQSDKVRDPEKMALLWKYSNEVRTHAVYLFSAHQ